MENEQVWSDSEVSCEEWSEGEVKEGEEDCKDNSSDTANGQDGCKDNASDKSQTSDLGVSPDLSISDSGGNQKTVACIIYWLIILKLYMTEVYKNVGQHNRVLNHVPHCLAALNYVTVFFNPVQPILSKSSRGP